MAWLLSKSIKFPLFPFCAITTSLLPLLFAFGLVVCESVPEAVPPLVVGSIAAAGGGIAAAGGGIASEVSTLSCAIL